MNTVQIIALSIFLIFCALQMLGAYLVMHSKKWSRKNSIGMFMLILGSVGILTSGVHLLKIVSGGQG